MNRVIRLVYRLGHRVMLLLWWVTHPEHRGSLVALWVDSNILLVKNSYRSCWSLPGGGIHANETPKQAAIREIQEELGICIDENMLSLDQESQEDFEHRRDLTYVFSVKLDMPPSPRIDRREIVEARFVSRKAALELELVPQLARYLRECA